MNWIAFWSSEALLIAGSVWVGTYIGARIEHRRINRDLQQQTPVRSDRSAVPAWHPEAPDPGVW